MLSPLSGEVGGGDTPVTPTPSATTVTVANISVGWTMQKYGNEPTSLKVKLNESPGNRKSLFQISSGLGDTPEVVEWTESPS